MMRRGPLPLAFPTHVLVLASLATACAIGDDQYPKPEDLSPEWLVDRLRVLAIQAEPPEAVPGETVRFSALRVDPFDEVAAVVWLACPSEGDVDFGCNLDPSFDFANATPEALAEQGFIGFEPVLQPVYTPPESLLEGLDDFEQRDGVYVLIQATALPESVIDGGPSEGFDFNQVEAAYKRLVVSTSTAPNRNPDVASLSVDGVEPPAGSVVLVDPAQDYTLGARITEGSDEFYSYTNAEGVTEERHEEPYLKWYTDGGTLLQDLNLFGYFDVVWRSPPRGSPTTEGTWWVVVRDRRGGIGWIAQPWRLRL